MNKLNFTYNWNNKLDCKAFTSLRLSNRFNIGDIITITLCSFEEFSVEVVGKKQLKLKDINEFIAYIDTGYDKKECQKILEKMYKNKNIDWNTQIIYFYLFKRI